MTSYTSRAQDCAQRIKLAQSDVAQAVASYRKGGSVDAVNRANAKLISAHNDLYTADGGSIPDDR